MTTIITWLTHKQVDCWNFTEKDRERLQALIPGSEVLVCRHKDEFLAQLPEAEVALVWRFDQTFFAHAKVLRWIATPAAGKDYFDIDLPAGVRLTYGQFHGRLMGETVAAMILAHCRGILASQTLRDTSPWPRSELSRHMVSLRGGHVVIVGFGHIGQWIARLLKPFGTRITGIRRRPPEKLPDFLSGDDRILPLEELDGVLPDTDHLILALPGTPETNRIVDARHLSRLPSHAAVYNVGRGNAIDEDALLKALDSGDLAAAYLDVFKEEPLPEKSPLRQSSKVFIMPHASAISPDYMPLFCEEFAGKFLAGKV